MRLAAEILLLPWAITGAATVLAVAAATVSRRFRRAFDAAVWGESPADHSIPVVTPPSV